MNSNWNDFPLEIVQLASLPSEARSAGFQPMRCETCRLAYDLPLYEMPDGPIVSVAFCPKCGARSHQVPEEVGV